MEIYVNKNKLLTDSDIPTSYWNLIDGSTNFSNIANGYGTKTDKKTPNNNVSFSKDTAWNYPRLNGQVESGTTYTFSYQLYISKNFNGSMQLFPNDQYTILNNGYIDFNTVAANQWIKNYCTFLSKVSGKICLGLSASADGLCYVGDYMLNKGTVALDWNYSLNDIKSKLGGVIRHLSACFSCLVTSTESEVA